MEPISEFWLAVISFFCITGIVSGIFIPLEIGLQYYSDFDGEKMPLLVGIGCIIGGALFWWAWLGWGVLKWVFKRPMLWKEKER